MHSFIHASDPSNTFIYRDDRPVVHLLSVFMAVSLEGCSPLPPCERASYGDAVGLLVGPEGASDPGQEASVPFRESTCNHGGIVKGEKKREEETSRLYDQ
jgi:hypothetical protein